MLIDRYAKVPSACFSHGGSGAVTRYFRGYISFICWGLLEIERGRFTAKLVDWVWKERLTELRAPRGACPRENSGETSSRGQAALLLARESGELLGVSVYDYTP
jgi:hypothetical protein